MYDHVNFQDATIYNKKVTRVFDLPSYNIVHYISEITVVMQVLPAEVQPWWQTSLNYEIDHTQNGLDKYYILYSIATCLIIMFYCLII